MRILSWIFFYDESIRYIWLFIIMWDIASSKTVTAAMKLDASKHAHCITVDCGVGGLNEVLLCSAGFQIIWVKQHWCFVKDACCNHSQLKPYSAYFLFLSNNQNWQRTTWLVSLYKAFLPIILFVCHLCVDYKSSRLLQMNMD